MKFLALICLTVSMNTMANSSQEMMSFMIEDNIGKRIGLKLNQNEIVEIKSSKWHLYPNISSDGKMLAYIKGSDQKNLRLVLKDLTTGKEEFLTKAGFVLHPKFAKNNSVIFYSQKQGEKNQISYIDLKTRVIKKINENISSFFPIPFQSAETIVYQRNAAQREIILYDILNDKKEVIAKGMSPAISKDEKYIAYTAKVDGNWDIFIYNRFNKSVARVTSNLAKDFSPSFDRYNNLIYTSDRNENGVFSIFKQSFKSWSNLALNESVLVEKKNVSYYSPSITGDIRYNLIQKPKMIGTPRSSFGTVNLRGIIYVIGGHQGAEHTYPPESFTGRMTSYDTKTGKWKNLAPRFNPSHGFQVVAHGKYLYAFGGFAYEESTIPKWKSLDVVERYNVETNTWEELKSPMPRKRSSNIVAKIENKVYVIGGWDSTPKFKDDIDGTFHSEIDVFDLKTLTWSVLGARLPKKRRAFSGFVKDNKIYMAGGISEGGSHFSLLDDFTELDPQTNTLTELAKLPYPTFAPATGYMKQKALMFGGMFKTGKWNYEYTPHIYEYDFNIKKWIHTGRYLQEYKGFSQITTIGDCLAILGGHSYQAGKDSPVNTFEKICLKLK